MENVRIIAPNLQEAMAKVKAELGENATIISWNNLGDAIEVVAHSGKPQNQQPPQALGEFQTKGGTAPRYDVFEHEAALKQKELAERQRALRAYGGKASNTKQGDKGGVGVLVGAKVKTQKPAKPIAPIQNEAPPPEPVEEKKKPVLHPLVPLLVKAGLNLKEIKPYASFFEYGGESSPHEILVKILEEKYDFEPLEAVPEHAIALIGPAGCGKTITAAKLAARALSAGVEVLLISTDTERQGGVEQLKGFAKKLGAAFNFADNVTEAAHLVRGGLDAGKVVIIDCAAASHVEPASLRVTERLIEETQAEPILCLPCDIRSDDIEDLIGEYKSLGVIRNILTRSDITNRRAGPLVGLLKHGMKVSLISASPFIAGGIVMASPQRLAGLILEPFDDL
jgi:flagellar biosynthesis GTPase FlhF